MIVRKKFVQHFKKNDIKTKKENNKCYKKLDYLKHVNSTKKPLIILQLFDISNYHLSFVWKMFAKPII
jgi:hypothetical protein